MAVSKFRNRKRRLLHLPSGMSTQKGVMQTVKIRARARQFVVRSSDASVLM